MAETKIEWTATWHADGTVTPGYSFNPWLGCTRVSPGCVNCYAESFARRYGKAEWGPTAQRVRTSAANWRKPLAWSSPWSNSTFPPTRAPFTRSGQSMSSLPASVVAEALLSAAELSQPARRLGADLLGSAIGRSGTVTQPVDEIGVLLGELHAAGFITYWSYQAAGVRWCHVLWLAWSLGVPRAQPPAVAGESFGTISPDHSPLTRNVSGEPEPPPPADPDPALTQNVLGDLGEDGFSPAAVWRQIKSELAIEQGGSFNRWVHDTWVIAYEDSGDRCEFLIGLPDAFRYDWIVHQLSKQIERKLQVILGRPAAVEFLVQPRPIGEREAA